MELAHPSAFTLCILLFLHACTAQQARSTQFPVKDGFDFVSRVQYWATNGGNEVLVLPGNITTANITYGTVPVNSTGKLTLQGRNYSVIDFAMQSFLTGQFNSPEALLDWKDVVLVNLCTAILPWNPELSLVIQSSSNTLMLPRSRTVQTQTRRNVIMYVSHGEMLGMVYWQMLYHIPFPDIQTYVKSTLLKFVAPTFSVISTTTPYSLKVASMTLPGGLDYDVEYRSTGNPDDPLRLSSLPGGSLMPHRFCSGSQPDGPLLSPAQLQANTTLFPMWIANSRSLQDVLLSVSTFLIDKKQSDPPPAVLLVGNATLASTTSTGITLRGDVLLHGPFNHVPQTATNVVLNMANASGLLNMPADAHLYVNKLTLSGLVSRPLPGTTLTSALPLWSIATYDTNANTATLANVTLIVPQQDYLAVLSAVARGEAWGSGAATTAPLFRGIVDFKPHPDTVASVATNGAVVGTTSSVVLDSYSGWGVNAVGLRIVPTSALPPTTLLLDPPKDTTAAGTSSGARKVAVAVGVGVGVGAAVMIAVLALVALLLRRQRRRGGGDAEKGVASGRATDAATQQRRQDIAQEVAKAQQAFQVLPSSHGLDQQQQDCDNEPCSWYEHEHHAHDHGYEHSSGTGATNSTPLGTSMAGGAAAGDLCFCSHDNGGEATTDKRGQVSPTSGHVDDEDGVRVFGVEDVAGEVQDRSPRVNNKDSLYQYDTTTAGEGAYRGGLDVTGPSTIQVELAEGAEQHHVVCAADCAHGDHHKTSSAGHSTGRSTSTHADKDPKMKAGSGGGKVIHATAHNNSHGPPKEPPGASPTATAGRRGGGSAGSPGTRPTDAVTASKKPVGKAGGAAKQQLSGRLSAAGSCPSSGRLKPYEAVQAAAGQIQKPDADKLTLIAVLGRGAWGTVYTGTWKGLTCAVKTVLFSEREDGDANLPHERAIMEAAVCTSVSHRNVVATFHYDIKPVRMMMGEDDGLVVEAATEGQLLGTTDWKLFLVQEWCNSTLGQALRNGLLHKDPVSSPGPGPGAGTTGSSTKEPILDLLLDLLLDIASGIDYLHGKSIIHGDLKPENVMLKADPSAQIGVVAKITDFGLSTTLAPQATHVSNYKSGTPFYVAPEVTAHGRTTKASDTYSLGVLMWEAYCCTPPWMKVKGEYRPNPSFPTFPATAPRPYVRLAQRCLSRDMRSRPAVSVVIHELRDMLTAWQAGYDNLEFPKQQQTVKAGAAAQQQQSVHSSTTTTTTSTRAPSESGCAVGDGTGLASSQGHRHLHHHTFQVPYVPPPASQYPAVPLSGCGASTQSPSPRPDPAAAAASGMAGDRGRSPSTGPGAWDGQQGSCTTVGTVVTRAASTAAEGLTAWLQGGAA